MGKIKNDITKGVFEFLGENQNDGVFSISLECTPKDSILSYVEFPVLGEKDDRVELSLEDARKMIIEKLGTRKLKFIFENLK